MENEGHGLDCLISTGSIRRSTLVASLPPLEDRVCSITWGIWGVNKNTKCFYSRPKSFLKNTHRDPERKERSDCSRRAAQPVDYPLHQKSNIKHQTSNMFHLRKRIKKIDRAGVLFFAFVAFSKLWAFFEELSVLSIFE